MPRPGYATRATRGRGENRVSKDERHQLGQEHLHLEAVGRVCSISGQSRDPKGLLGQNCGTGLYGEKRERGMGLGARNAGSALPHRPGGDELHPPVLGGGIAGVFSVPSANSVGWPEIGSDDLLEGSYNCAVERMWGVGADSLPGNLVSVQSGSPVPPREESVPGG